MGVILTIDLVWERLHTIPRCNRDASLFYDQMNAVKSNLPRTITFGNCHKLSVLQVRTNIRSPWHVQIYIRNKYMTKIRALTESLVQMCNNYFILLDVHTYGFMVHNTSLVC